MTVTNKDEYIQACDVCKLPISYNDRFDIKLLLAASISSPF